ncbi:MAG: DUF6273 domain-containing protein, partial [Lentihominibacter sp.]
MKKRRLLSIVLSLCMVLALMPQMVFAEEGTGSTPSVSAYATKDQLKGDTFAPNLSGYSTNIGKLVFGKNSSGSSQEWYILGADTGVSVDNTIIFAASPIATGQMFNSSKSDKTYSYGAGTGYGESEGSRTVYADHYGASDLRMALKTMAENTNYFTEAEQGMMNATTVRTKDTMHSVEYTVTDKLYALASSNYGVSYKQIQIGTNNQINLFRDQYWNSGSSFWVRSPFGYGNHDEVLCVFPGSIVDKNEVLSNNAVRPASNLNLSSVLFASAATAASSETAVSDTITSDTAMTLRLDGSSKNIGAVAYRTATGDIFATKGSTTGDVALMVQGNDGTNDWYYSKKIDTSETINVSAIASESNTPASIDLSACKIWLE